MTNNRIELLAPAGNLSILKTAIDSGADSVYLGLKEFSARASATAVRAAFFSLAFCKASFWLAERRESVVDFKFIGTPVNGGFDTAFGLLNHRGFIKKKTGTIQLRSA